MVVANEVVPFRNDPQRKSEVRQGGLFSCHGIDLAILILTTVNDYRVAVGYYLQVGRTPRLRWIAWFSLTSPIGKTVMHLAAKVLEALRQHL